jgi:hypothetical protein
MRSIYDAPKVEREACMYYVQNVDSARILAVVRPYGHAPRKSQHAHASIIL